MTIRTLTLACGMTLVVESMPNVRSVGLSWLIPAGAARDPENRIGRAAMWAELMLRGAGSRSSREHADALDALGVNRSSDVGSRCLTLSASLLGDRLHEALPLLADAVMRPRFDPEAIEPARDLCLQAIDALDDDPSEKASLACRQRHVPPPFNRSTMGERDGIGALTRDELADSWRREVVPGGSILAVAGHADADAIAATLDALLAGWSGSAADPRSTGAPPRGYAHAHDDTQQVQIILMHDAPPLGSPDHEPERLVNAVLSGGMSSRLFTEVRERRALCYAVSAGYSADRDRGTVTAYVGSRPDTAQQALDVLRAELARIADPQGVPTAEELVRAVTGLKSRLVFSGESTGARAAALATDMLHLGRPRTLAERAAAIDAVTPAGLRDYLARRTLGTCTIQTLGPSPLAPLP